MKTSILFLFLLFLLLAGCRSHINVIGEGSNYNWARRWDTIPVKDTLTFYWSKKETSLEGKYYFTILTGYEGVILELFKDKSIRSNHWADVYPFSIKQKGRWHAKEGTLEIKQGFKRSTFLVHQYAWATFLVPKYNQEKFAYYFNRNRTTIDTLTPYASVDFRRTIGKLREFNALCFIGKRISGDSLKINP